MSLTARMRLGLYAILAALAVASDPARLARFEGLGFARHAADELAARGEEVAAWPGVALSVRALGAALPADSSPDLG